MEPGNVSDQRQESAEKTQKDHENSDSWPIAETGLNFGDFAGIDMGDENGANAAEQAESMQNAPPQQ